MTGYNDRYLWWLSVKMREEVARKAAAAIEQRGRDLARVADALQGFYEHPNTPAADKTALTEALVRLFPPDEVS